MYAVNQQSKLDFIKSLFSRKTAYSLAPTLTNVDTFGAYVEPIIQLFKPTWRYNAISAKLVSINNESSNVYTLSLKPNSSWHSFTAGQFVQLTVEKNGSLVTRTFSISSSPRHFKETGCIELSIRIQDKGLITPWLLNNVPLESTVYLSKAMGDFTLQNTVKHKLFIAAGSGITPIRSILNEHIHSAWLKDATLLFYVRNHSELLFSQDLQAYKNAGLHCKIIYTEESGHISEQHLKTNVPDFKNGESYICGPREMIQSTVELLCNADVAAEHIHFEYFGQAPIEALDLNEEDFEPDEAIQVDYLSSQKQVKFNPDGIPKTLLELAEQEGLQPTSGCRMGICHQCICKKKQGRVYNTKTKQYSDSGAEEIQLCVSVPIGNVELEL